MMVWWIDETPPRPGDTELEKPIPYTPPLSAERIRHRVSHADFNKYSVGEWFKNDKGKVLGLVVGRQVEPGTSAMVGGMAEYYLLLQIEGSVTFNGIPAGSTVTVNGVPVGFTVSDSNYTPITPDLRRRIHETHFI
jgi:hypothetical protein